MGRIVVYMDYNAVVSIKQLQGDENDKKQGFPTLGLKAVIIPAGDQILALNPELPVGQGYSFVVLSDILNKILPESEIDVTTAMNSDLSTSDVFIVKGMPRKNKVLGQIHFSGTCVKKNI
jgi:hypothetical protein